MNPIEELYHSVLQKMIIALLGLLTVSVLLTSCMTGAQKHCAAYSDVDVEVTDDLVVK